MNYLNERHGVDINAVFFSYARLKDGQEVIARTILVPDETQQVRAGKRTTSVADVAGDVRTAADLRHGENLPPSGGFPERRGGGDLREVIPVLGKGASGEPYGFRG